MASSGRVKGWRDLLASYNVIPVAFDRQNAESEISTPFNLNIKLIEGLIPQSETSVTEYRVQVTLYDVAYKQFFGRTWVGPTMAVKPQTQPFKLPYDQHVYFHTSLNDPSIAIVLEVVATTTKNDGKRQEVSCGWGTFHLFRYKGDMPDTSNSATVPAQRIDIFHGSPRMLFYLDEPILESPVLTTVNGCQLVYNIRTHHQLQKVMHLMPENVIIGANDILPGIAEGFRSGRTPGLVDNLKKPRLLKSISCQLERIVISLSPNAEQFESELCRIMNEERITQEALRPDGRRLEIIKRYLQIGIHNGWTYVADPEIVQLTIDSTDNKGSTNASFRRNSINRRSSQRIASTALVSVNKNSVLVHKSRTHLEGMVEDPMFTIVFMLIYELGEPRIASDRMATMARTSFSVIVRWAAFSPLTNFEGPDHSLDLVGGPTRNPENMLVFYRQSDDTIASSANLAGLTGGNLSFSFSSSKMGGMVSNLEVPMTDSMAVDGMGETVQQVHTADLYSTPTSQKPPKHRNVAEAAVQVSKTPRPTGQAMYPSQPMGYHVPPAGTPQGYMPIAIQHVSDTAAVSPPGTARTSSDLHELPFTPTHIPILPAAPGLHSGIGLPRSAYAKLSAAGFPQVLDRNGEPPEVIDPGDPMNFEMGLEERDRLPANEIILQFLAFSRMNTFETEPGIKSPATVFFTFQFYRFPQITSERLLLGDIEGELSCNPSALPCVLQRLDKDGSLMKGPPGYQVKYHVDPAYLKPGEGRLFLEHLSEQILHIDVWNGDSLMLIGSSTVELKHLCRQGLEAIQLTYELDVLVNEYSQDDSVLPSGGVSRDGTFCPPEAKPLLKGRLHLRLANIGYPSDGKYVKTGAVAVKPTVIVKNDVDTSHFIGGGLSAPNLTALYKSQSNIAKHLVESNYEVASLLSSRKDKFNTNQQEGTVERKRKLARMQKIRQLESHENMPVITSFRKQKEERARDLKTIELYRDQGKNEGILNMLAQAITTKHYIHPSLGTAQYFEYVLRNPYNTEHTITIDCDDRELTVITDPREWRHFRMLNQVYASIEEGMFNMETPSGKPEIFLRPKESVNVPFKFLTFRADDRVQPQEPLDTHKLKARQGFVPKKDAGGVMDSRMTKVYFNTRDKKPIAILMVNIEPQPHVTNQTFRFHHPEQSFLKKSIRFMQTQHLPGMPIPVTDSAGLRQIYIRCSDSNVICSSRSVSAGEPHDIFLKVACGASPQIKRFYIAVYLDPYLSKPVQIWQFDVHALQRVDVACTEGETTQFTLVVRGTQATRLVQCFSSHPLEMQLQPRDPFMLAANTVHEISTAIRPLRSGCKFLYVNVVDVESHQLLRTWLICATAKPPHIEKAFELELPLGGGRGCNKRISYTNPYQKRRVFHVHTNHPELLQFKDTRLELDAGETQSIGMKFAPYMNRGILEILVYINDENDKTEEVFCVKAVYK